MKGERDEAARAKVLAALGRGESVTAAAKAGGVARQTPYQWADRGDLEMRDALAAAKRGGGPRPADRDQERAPGPPAPSAPAPAVRQKLHKDERLALEALREVAGGGESEMCRVVASKALLEHHRKRRQDAEAKKIAAPPPSLPPDGDGEDLGALITRLSG